MFDVKNKQVPCIGVSIGVERLFAVMEAKQAARNQKQRTTEVELYVASAQKNLHEERMKLINELWEDGFKVIIFLESILDHQIRATIICSVHDK